MSTYERELTEKLRKLESIDARLARHEKATRLGLRWLIILAAAVLALTAYHIARL